MNLKAVFLVGLLFTSCQAERQNDPLKEGMQEIDQGQYNEAVQDLEELHSKDPSPTVKMALASAYAGRAGVETLDLLNFAETLQGNPLSHEHLMERPSYLKNQESVASVMPLLPAETQQRINDFFLNWAALEVYHEKFELYPYVPVEKRPDLEKAVAILSGISDPGARLYRATLEAVLVRSELDDGFDIWNSLGNPLAEVLAHPLDFQKIFCEPRIGGFTGWMDRQFSRTQEISSDLSVSFPSRANEAQQFSMPVQGFRDKIPGINAAFVPQGCPNDS